MITNKIFRCIAKNGAPVFFHALSCRVWSVVLHVAWVVLENLVAELRTVDVHIDFGCGDALVPQHLLNGAQIGSTLKQMGGK